MRSDIIPEGTVTAHIETAEESVRRIVQDAENWRKSREMPRVRFIERFRSYFGSSKTYNLLLTRPSAEWERRSPEKWLSRLSGLPTALADEDARGDEGALIDLPHTRVFADALRALRQQRGLRRVLLVEGGTGSGKTSLLDLAESRLGEGRKVVRIRGRQSWDSLHEMLGDWLHALGEKDLGPTTARRHRQVSDALASLGDAIIMVDEAQYLTARGVNSIKDWCNDMAERGNAVHFILGAMDTLWRKLTESASEESRQLRVNRTLDVLKLSAPDAAEVLDLLGVSLDLSGWTDRERHEVSGNLSRLSETAGLRAFVRDVRSAAAELVDEATPGLIGEISTVIASKNRTRR
ncbi:MAG: AAA domain-containing protein [Verrucomicrobia bacterium]|nr:MAG: AAA domain-containing protein [Verrucomicrobiota bacterium]